MMPRPQCLVVLLLAGQDATGFTGISPQVLAQVKSGFSRAGRKLPVAANMFGWGSKTAVGDAVPAGTASTDGAARVRSDLKSSGAVLYTTSSGSDCKNARAVLNGVGATFMEVQVDVDSAGAAIRAELKKLTGRTQLPSVWINGKFVGGLSDGGGAGGLMGLAKADMLVPMLRKAGAVKKGAFDRTPLAPLFGNNLRDALGSLGGSTGEMRNTKSKKT